MKANNKNLANFLFEVATLKRLQRTGWQILGENEESVAEHSFLVSVISYILAVGTTANIEKVLLMALFHDFTETRTGDINKLADLYVKTNVAKTMDNAFSSLPTRDKLIKIVKEYEGGKSLEAKIVHDADTLALCLELKQLMEKGNQNAKEWYSANLEIVKLETAKKLAEEIKKSNSQDWWKKEREKLHKKL